MPEITENTTMNDLLGRYRALLDEKDDISAKLSGINSMIDDVEGGIRAKLESEGQWKPGAKIGAPGLTVTVTEKARATYEPERWGEIVRWAAEHGLAHMVQRRLNDKAVLELIDGGKPLPAGLSIRFDTELSFRRS